MNQVHAQVSSTPLRGEARAKFERRRAERQEFARREETRYRDLLAAESERALLGEPPTVWDGCRFGPWMQAPIALTDYPQRGPSGSLVLCADAVPEPNGRHVFADHGLRVVRLTCADGRSWLEISEVPR
jgi:hypothetical protein